MKTRLAKLLLWTLLGLIGFCLGAALIFAAVNRTLPTHSQTVEQLTEADLARLDEALHLRRSLGEAIWPGWGEADIPILLYNESYAFLTGLDAPAAGWVKVPDTQQRGEAWAPVEGLHFHSQPVYRQAVQNADRVIGAFTVQVGDRWIATLGTRPWSEVSFYRGFREEIPPILREVFPYPLIWKLLMGNTAQYISALLHESFHAYQGMLLPQKLADAELSARLESEYPWESSQAGWQAELDALASAAQSEYRQEQLALACRFLQLRQQRRSAPDFTPAFIAYERQREWLEGLAKYAELSILLAAARSPDYRPSTELASLDKDFKGYTGLDRFYQAQLSEVRRLGGRSEETRFYYAGMAQAVLLDRFNPAWKPLAMQDGIYLEDILTDSLKEFTTCP